MGKPHEAKWKFNENSELYLERTKRNHYWLGGEEGQLRLSQLKVGVAGLGGMGSNIAEILVRLGIKHLKVADPDTIELSNLNRQVIANLGTIGMTKANASIYELKNIDSSLDVKVYPEGIQKNNVDDFVEGLDFIINEIDVFHIKNQVDLLSAARVKKIPVYTTLVVGLGIHLYKYDPNSNFTHLDFLKNLLGELTPDNLLETFAQPYPSYLNGEMLNGFKREIQEKGVPIFGASTYLGQSLLVIRTLVDQGLFKHMNTLPETPCLPRFLILDPLTLELKSAKINEEGRAELEF